MTPVRGASGRPPSPVEGRGEAAPSESVGLVERVRSGLGWRLRRMARKAVERGVSPAIFGYRWIGRETLEARPDGRRSRSGVHTETVHPTTEASNPLPRNVPSREQLPDDRGWWGYSMHDVPARTSHATVLATIRGARVLPFHDPVAGCFRPAILTAEQRSLELREISFRTVHGRLLRSAPPPDRLETATWIAERVYDNYSHWLTAHLPKLLLLRDLNMLGDVLLPRERNPVMEASMRRLGLDPSEFGTFEIGRPLDVSRLTVLSTDRFRPELLLPVREAFGSSDDPPFRRIYISRSRAERRRLVNEDEVWPLLRDEGFQRVHMEEIGFDAQVALMQETRCLFAPHGAGLTNMMFCPEGAQVVEIADPGFPNPNFYALASAMGHGYWLLPGTPLGDAHPLERDLWVEPRIVEKVLEALPDEGERSGGAWEAPPGGRHPGSVV